MSRRSLKSTSRLGPRSAFAAVQRNGLTLLELLLAISIMVLIAGSLGALAQAVQSGAEFGEGHGTAAQHARVTLERITRTVSEATASEQFPGLLVVAEEIGSWRFPDTLVVWHPRQGSARNPDGLPCFDELVVYCPNPQAPNQLWELTIPVGSDTRAVPSVGDKDGWRAELQAIKALTTASRVVLTDRLRTAALSAANSTQQRGAVRFVDRLRPSKEEWDKYQSGVLSWERLSWAQGIYGPATGLRQVWGRIELQLLPIAAASGNTSRLGSQAIPFFGSATLYYDMHAKTN